MNPPLLWVGVSVMVMVTTLYAAGSWRARWLLRRDSELWYPTRGALTAGSGAGYAVVTITADTRGFEAALRRAGAAAEKMGRALRRVAADVAPIVRGLQRGREVAIVGLGARYYVRGGLGCRTVEDLDAVVRAILSDTGDEPILALLPLTRLERAELAVEAMRGWVIHADPWRRTEPEPAGTRYVRSLVRWHWWGAAAVKVDNLMTGRTYMGWGPIP